MSSQKNGSLYIGVTSNLIKRVYEHKHKMVKGFTQQYGITRLVWYETHDNMYEAITREKQLKTWQRQWKINLIEKQNPNWNDLYTTIT